jgi:hypothetical protein
MEIATATDCKEKLDQLKAMISASEIADTKVREIEADHTAKTAEIEAIKKGDNEGEEEGAKLQRLMKLEAEVSLLPAKFSRAQRIANEAEEKAYRTIAESLPCVEALISANVEKLTEEVAGKLRPYCKSLDQARDVAQGLPAITTLANRLDLIQSRLELHPEEVAELMIQTLEEALNPPAQAD